MKALLLIVLIVLVGLLIAADQLHRRSKKIVKETFYEDVSGDIYSMQTGASQFETITKLEADMRDVIATKEQVTNDLNAFKSDTTKHFGDIDTRFNQFQTDSTTKFSTLQESAQAAHVNIQNIQANSLDFNKQFKTITDNVVVINGRLVDMTNAQDSMKSNFQKSINSLTNDTVALNSKIDNNYDSVLSRVNTGMTNLTNNINSTFTKQSDTINNVNDGLTVLSKSFNTFKTDQTTINQSDQVGINDVKAKTTSLQEAIDNAQQRISDVVQLLNDYLKITDMTNYASKTDLSAYPTRTELENYAKKTVTSEFISRNELSVYVSKLEFKPLLDAIISANGLLSSLSQTVGTISSNYVTKTELPNLVLDESGSTTLKTAIDGTKSAINNLSNNLADIKASLTNYVLKTEADSVNSTFALKTDLGIYAKTADLTPFATQAGLDAAVQNLNNLISDVKSNTALVLDTLQVNTVINANQIKAHPNTYTQQIPAGWAGGVHTQDLYANGAIGAGTNAQVNAYLSSSGEVTGKKFKSLGDNDWNWYHVYRNDKDQLYFGGDETNRGIISTGPRDFTVYHNDGTGMLGINKDTGVTTKGKWSEQLKIDGGGDNGAARLRMSAEGPSAKWYGKIQADNTKTGYAGPTPLLLNPEGGGVTINASDYPQGSLDVRGPTLIGDKGVSGLFSGATAHLRKKDGPVGMALERIGNNTSHIYNSASNDIIFGNEKGSFYFNTQHPYNKMDGDGNQRLVIGQDGNVKVPVQLSVGSPAYQPIDTTPGTLLHGNGAIRSKNTSEPDWVHKLYGKGARTIHMINNTGYGMHINTDNQESTKYSLELHNNSWPTYQVLNNGRTSHDINTGTDWGWQLQNRSGNRQIYMAHGTGLGMQIVTNDQNANRYGLEVHNGQNQTFAVMNNGTVKAPGILQTPNLQADFVRAGNSGVSYDVPNGPDGTLLHANGSIRSKNTTESDWVHKLFGKGSKNVHLVGNQGNGMHINTDHQGSDKYGLEIHNNSWPTYQVWNNGRIWHDVNHDQWAWELRNKFNNNDRHIYMGGGNGNGMHINTQATDDTYGLQVMSAGREGLTVYNNGEKRWMNRNGQWTHFDHYPTGNNYIRGTTYFDNGPVILSQGLEVSGNLCVGGVCINGDHLRMLTGEKPVKLTSSQTGRSLENGGAGTPNETVKSYAWDGSTNKKWTINMA